ncbi:hypothetical protein LPUS_08982 [Lasallia pustulata]|uniref:Flavin-binding monooxygenase n=1 Tax=Lasallia pustulata TaxID=136370 RepID=A0A1W5D6X5_9LECA|nr:hypothetical protein LPUS_08982 [Lasallia pustulata]
MSSETIRVVNGYDQGAYTYYPVLIVGAGESGIAMACRLKEELGFDQFRIFDRQSGMGGTWWINRYPGVACDIPAVFYSFSFCPNNKWTTFHPSGQEIVKYLHGVCEKYEIVDKIQLNTQVTEVRWLEDEEIWEVTLTHMFPGTGDLSEHERKEKIAKGGRESVYMRDEIVRAKIVASAAGGLVEPRGWPDRIPGRETFEGDIFHSARWDYDVNLNGKDVIVVGTGCSAAQFLPRLTKAPFNAKSVTQIMRSPPWVVPRPLPPFGAEAWEKWSPVLFDKIPGLSRVFRTFLFAIGELDFFKIFHNSPFNQRSRAKMEADLLRHMRKNVPEKYHEILTPDYGVGCKRRIFDATWFPGLNDPTVDLTTQPLTSVQAKTVTLGPGRTYPDPQITSSTARMDEVTLPADTIILANGFDVTTWLHPLRVRGKGGKYMHDVWDERGGPQAYMGAAMDGFPNFFIIFGPNTATGHSSVILASENMANYCLKFMKPLLKGDVKTFEVTHEAEVAWTREIQESLKETVWMSGGCRSWYKTPDGWNAVVYP